MKNEIQAAWCKAVNDKNNWSYKDPTYGNKVHGKLRARNYLIYNIVRGLPLDRGFCKNENFETLVKHFANTLGRAWLGAGMNRNFALKYLTADLEFFGDSLDITEFMEDANEALRLYSNP